MNKHLTNQFQSAEKRFKIQVVLSVFQSYLWDRSSWGTQTPNTNIGSHESLSPEGGAGSAEHPSRLHADCEQRPGGHPAGTAHPEAPAPPRGRLQAAGPAEAPGPHPSGRSR